MRWSLRLAEFDFDIEHESGTKMGYVDALSLHIATVSERYLLLRRCSFRSRSKMSFVSIRGGSVTVGRQHFF
jgi:hypothetical protein